MDGDPVAGIEVQHDHLRPPPHCGHYCASNATNEPGAGGTAQHIRSGDGGAADACSEQHPIEVASSERHTVKPWFAGRVDFSPPVPALDSLGILLIGGRVDTVETAPAAVLAYRKRLHLVGVFVRPDGSGSVEPLMGESRGYNVVRWQERGFRFAAVSDLNAAELRAFAEAFRLGAR